MAQLASAQGAGVAVCDVFGVDSKQRLVAPADSIAAAIDWLLSGNLRVINISIEGPRNEVLEFVIDAALARGTAIVAAVGNGGPSAPPGYPAAYPGVIAVTALDEKGLVYRRAGRGKQVQFAARGGFPGTGAPVVSAEPVSGTSFAAPLVAARDRAPLACEPRGRARADPRGSAHGCRGSRRTRMGPGLRMGTHWPATVSTVLLADSRASARKKGLPYIGQPACLRNHVSHSARSKKMKERSMQHPDPKTVMVLEPDVIVRAEISAVPAPVRFCRH